MALLLSLRTKLTETYPFGGPKRQPVADEMVDWCVPWPDYKPPYFTSERVLTNKEWADKELVPGGTGPVYKWNQVDGPVNRVSLTWTYKIDHNGYPLNPAGRTGIAGRGALGKWGPNHAADAIVTRPKPNPDGTMVAEDAPKGVFQFIGIQRKDTGEWAIPGGMMETGETGLAAAKREFYEEVFNTEKASETEKQDLDKSFSKLFSVRPAHVYQGYVDDPRNTDNAWMETLAVQYHAGSVELQKFLASITFKAGSDAKNASWVDISSSVNLYASHKYFIKRVVERNYWQW